MSIWVGAIYIYIYIYIFVQVRYELCEFCLNTSFQIRRNIFVWRIVSKIYISFLIKTVLWSPGIRRFRFVIVSAKQERAFLLKWWVISWRMALLLNRKAALFVGSQSQYLQKDKKSRWIDTTCRSERWDTHRSLAWTPLSSDSNTVLLRLVIPAHSSAALQVSL